MYTFVNEDFIEKIKENKLSGVAVFDENINWLSVKPTILNKSTLP